MGASNHVLIMHHHNIMHSAVGGQNMTRFITPHGGTIFAPAYQTRPGSRSEPNGFVMAPLFITIPWDSHYDQVLDSSYCQNATDITVNLTQHTNYSCLSAVDWGYVYGTHQVDYAMWDNDRCITCMVAGNQSDWKWVPKKGSIGYVRRVGESERSYRRMLKYDMNGDGVVGAEDMEASMIRANKELEEAQWSLEIREAREKAAKAAANDDSDDDDEDDDDEDDDDRDDSHVFNLEPVDLQTKFEQDKARALGAGVRGSVYILKSFNYGSGWSNWTYSLIPSYIGVPSFVTDPTNQSVIYTVNGNCIAASYDTGDTWSPCWNDPSQTDRPHVGLEGSFHGMAIKDSQNMIVNRNNDVPLKTKDGGATWVPMNSCKLVARTNHGLIYSWTGKTLIMMGSGGTQSVDHPHAAFVWVSKDDGETWVDETSDMLVTMGPGAANWYENDFYINSMGQGIMVKTLE